MAENTETNPTEKKVLNFVQQIITDDLKEGKNHCRSIRMSRHPFFGTSFIL